MSNPKIKYDAPYLDDEEREIMEAFDTAIDNGDVKVSTEEERANLNAKWRDILKQSQQRKAITLRLQNRDLSRLKSMAKRKGIPYQTLVTSILHQYVNGDVVERER